jgi:hypothetical protein
MKAPLRFALLLAAVLCWACSPTDADVDGSTSTRIAHLAPDAGIALKLPATLGGAVVQTQAAPSGESVTKHRYGIAVPPVGSPDWPARYEEHGLSRLSLPASVDLSAGAPPAGNQGSTDSCQTWATSYSALGWWASHAGLANAQFAPMYIYSQIARGNCSTEDSIEAPLDLLEAQGVDTLTDYQPMQDNLNCGTLPDGEQRTNASRFRISGYTRNDLSNGVQTAIMSQLASGAPATLAIIVYSEFENANASSYLVGPPQAGDVPYGGHAITAFAYDANGVWILNQWGTEWGYDGWAELSWDFVNGSFGGQANVGDVASITGLAFSCTDSNQDCAAWAATQQCQVNPGYMLTNCCASCANPDPCVNETATCEGLGYYPSFTFQPVMNPSSCMDLRQDDSANYTPIDEYACNGTPAQTFEILAAANGLINLYHPQTGKCVDVQHRGTADGTPIDLYACNGTPAQTFQVVTLLGGTVQFLNPNSGRCIDVAGANPANYTALQLWDCNASDAAQIWTVRAP